MNPNIKGPNEIPGPSSAMQPVCVYAIIRRIKSKTIAPTIDMKKPAGWNVDPYLVSLLT